MRQCELFIVHKKFQPRLGTNSDNWIDRRMLFQCTSQPQLSSFFTLNFQSYGIKSFFIFVFEWMGNLHLSFNFRFLLQDLFVTSFKIAVITDFFNMIVKKDVMVIVPFNAQTTKNNRRNHNVKI